MRVGALSGVVWCEAMTLVLGSACRQTVLEVMATRGVGGFKESSKLAVHEQPATRIT